MEEQESGRSVSCEEVCLLSVNLLRKEIVMAFVTKVDGMPDHFRAEKREGLSSDCKLDKMVVMAILIGGREHPCDRCNLDRKECRGYPRL
jgi:hypothetical protein